MSDKPQHLTAYEQLVLDELRATRSSVEQLRRVVSGDSRNRGLVTRVARLRWEMRIVMALMGVVLATGKGDHLPAAASAIREVAASAQVVRPGRAGTTQPAAVEDSQ